MADRMPDYHIEQQRLVAQISDLKLRVERFKLELMEIEGRRKNALANWDATEKAIKDSEKKLAALVKEHGGVDVDWDALRAAQGEDDDG